MTRLTTQLLRKRAEHNECVLSNLKEIALHQQELEKIEVIGDVCRELEILYLSNNYIPRIEGLKHLKFLTYLNLAVNNICVIEGLEGCESLVKLDLTLNFIPDPSSTTRLRANIFLETLHLTGNPCTQIPGYRHFVVQALPQLKALDGEDVVRTEQIVARQDKDETVANAEDAAMRAKEQERLKQEMLAQGIDPFPPRYNEKGERVYGHTPEERLQILRENQEEERKRQEAAKPAGSISATAAELNKKPTRLSAEEEIEKYGRVLLRNEAKLDYRMDESDKDVVLTVQPGKFISTSSISIDAQPTYIRITIKGKLLQLVMPVEVAVDKIQVQRAMTTGELKITMPLAAHVLKEREEKKNRYKKLSTPLEYADADDDDNDDDDAGETRRIERPTAGSRPATRSPPTDRQFLGMPGETPDVAVRSDSSTVQSDSKKDAPMKKTAVPATGRSRIEVLDDD